MTARLHSEIMREQEERFGHLLRVLRSVYDREKRQKKKFLRMHSWFDVTHRCGTAACAAGWFALDGWAQKQGFFPDDAKTTVVYAPKTRARTMGAEACSLFFRINSHETDFIFGARRLSTMQVIERVKKVMEDRGLQVRKVF